MTEHKSASANNGPSQKIALLALFGGAVGISFAAIFVRLSGMDPTSSAFYRTLLAIPLFLMWPLLIPQKKASGDAADQGKPFKPALFIVAGLFFAGDLGFWHYSIKLTSVANATLFPNLAPIFVTFASWYFFKERITREFLLGLLVATIGAVIVLGDSLGQGEGHVVGDILGLITAIFYAGYFLAIARLRKTCNTLTIMTWVTIVTALALLPVALMSGQSLVPRGLQSWAALFALAWFSHAGGQGLIAYALAQLPVSFSSVGLLVQPAMAALFAFLILGEPLGMWQGVGLVVILAGIYLARRGSSS